MYTRTSNSGFAIVLVVLVTAVALLGFLFAASTMAVASRSSAAQERASTQALLAADSALKTLNVRALDHPNTSADFRTWISSTEALSSVSLDGGVSAVLDSVSYVENAPGEPFVIVAYTGLVRSGAGGAVVARRTVVQDFMVEPSEPVDLSINAPAALTSVGSVVSNTGAARVVGVGSAESDWTFENKSLCELLVGEYVQVGLDWRPVIDVGDQTQPCESRWVAVEGGIGSDLGDQLVTARPFAITETLSVSVNEKNQTVSRVGVTESTRALFGKGASISIGLAEDGISDSLGTVSGIVVADDGSVEMEILWSQPPANRVMPEATVIRRSVFSAVTQGTCPEGENYEKVFLNECTQADLSDLFRKTFGTTLDNVLKQPDLSSFTTLSQVTAAPLTGWNYFKPESKNEINNVLGQSGSGVLIIDATDSGGTVGLRVDNAFVGVIYVIGDAALAGNTTYTGTVIVEGAVSVKNNDGTSVDGTVDIGYSPWATSRALAGLTRPSDDPDQLGGPVEASWRLR